MSLVSRGALLLVLILTCACGGDPAGAARPNVVVVVMDTARGDRVSFNSYSEPTTPYLESLGKESTVYTNAWSPSCWTGPAHASLFTGLRPEHHGFLLGIRYYLDAGAFTLAERLQAVGYSTLFLTCNPMVGPETGLTQGFGVAELVPETAENGLTASHRATIRALDLTKECRDGGRPFFLVLNDWEPHLAYNPPPDVSRRFLPPDGKWSEFTDARAFLGGKEAVYGMAASRFSARKWEILSGLYDGEIATLDAELERLFEGLRAAGLLDDTVLVITSDHGENLGEKGRCGHYMSAGRTVLHIPLLVRYPPRFRAGERIDTVVRLEDVFPTVLDLCGVAAPADIDGASLLTDKGDRVARAIVGGELKPDVARDYPEYARSGIWRPVRSAFDGRFHLIQRNDGHEELYDVPADPGEKVDVSKEHADLLPGLRALLPESHVFR